MSDSGAENGPTKRVRWARAFPEMGTGPIATDRCLSPEYFALEREKLFKRVWLKVGRVDEIPNPRDYKVKRLDFANTSVILTHGEDGRIRGFHNICSHRGNKVVWGDDTYGLRGTSRTKTFACHFHGWVYNLKGELVGVPQEELFFQLDKCQNGLPEIATDTWEGFIFVNLDPSPTQSLKEFVGEHADRLGGFPFAAMTAVYEYYTVLNCNWKIAWDAFSEAYHVSTVHAGSFPGVFDAEVKQVGMYGIHHSGAAHQEPSPPVGRVAALSYQLATASIAKPGFRSSLPARINPDRSPDFVFDQSAIFPNFLIHVSEGLYFTHQFWPISLDQTLWEGIQYFLPARNAGERFSQEFGQILQRNAWLEDTGTMEATQLALSSGVKKFFHFQDGEIMLRHNYQVIDEYVNRP
jgi:phenylpropionate dioxygenase-like ring-hydroxylating dioxygenase large terminal subunit